MISSIFILTHWNSVFWSFLCINNKETKLVYIQYTCWSMNVVICWCSWKTAVQSKSILHDSSSFLSTTDFLIKFLLHNDFPFLWFFKSFCQIKFTLASSFSFSSVQIYKRYITIDFVLLQTQWSIEIMLNNYFFPEKVWNYA